MSHTSRIIKTRTHYEDTSNDEVVHYYVDSTSTVWHVDPIPPTVVTDFPNACEEVEEKLLELADHDMAIRVEHMKVTIQEHEDGHYLMRLNRPRRVALYPVNSEALFRLFQSSTPKHLSGIPYGSKLVGAHYSDVRATFELVVEHESFESVEEDKIPQVGELLVESAEDTEATLTLKRQNQVIQARYLNALADLDQAHKIIERLSLKVIELKGDTPPMVGPDERIGLIELLGRTFDDPSETCE